MKFNPYLTFGDNCAEAFARYAEIFGAKIAVMQRFSDAPSGPSMFREAGDKIMHAQLHLDGAALMASDMWGEGSVDISGIQIQMGYDDLDDAQRVFNALAEGGEIEQPFAETFWADGFGIVKDRFGVSWIVNCDQQRT